MKYVFYFAIIATCSFVVFNKWKQAQTEKAQIRAEQAAVERQAAAAPPGGKPAIGHMVPAAQGSQKEPKVRDTRDILPWKNKPDNLGKGGSLDQPAH